MTVVEPGHVFVLAPLDGAGSQVLRFVKRVGPLYPGNERPEWAGTTTQEVLRALIARTIYVDGQLPNRCNALVLSNLRASLWALEDRAADRHNRPRPWRDRVDVENIPTCASCGHIGCSAEHP